MPTKDEDGNFFGPDWLPIAMRGDDGKEISIPCSITVLQDATAIVEDQEEHDCLPPLEHTGSWELSAKAVQKLAEVFDQIVHAVGQIYAAFVPIDRASRRYRKIIRWDERNRRRRLKGLPEKACPYPRIWKTCIIERKEDGYDGNLDEHPATVGGKDPGSSETLGTSDN